MKKYQVHIVPQPPRQYGKKPKKTKNAKTAKKAKKRKKNPKNPKKNKNPKKTKIPKTQKNFSRVDSELTNIRRKASLYFYGMIFTTQISNPARYWINIIDSVQKVPISKTLSVNRKFRNIVSCSQQIRLS